MRNAAVLTVLAVLALAGCDGLAGFSGPGPAVPPLELPAVDEDPSPESIAIRAYYARVEQDELARGLLRADGGGPDTPYDAGRLARTFQKLAFAREYSDLGPALVHREGASILHRWTAPVRIETVFGGQTDDALRPGYSADIADFARRLGRITGHPVFPVSRRGNFHVLVLTEDERRVSGPMLRRLLPQIREREVRMIQDLDRATYCLVVTADGGQPGVLTSAVAVIRAELPPALRLSCIHEEIAQGLGLSNDSPDARPSIFNDDDEFGRLTAMDELMLKMLYDPRLSPGMDGATAAPVVGQIARELLPGTM